MKSDPAAAFGASHAALVDWATQTLSGDPGPWPLDQGPAAVRSARSFFETEGVGPLCYHALRESGAEGRVPAAVRALLEQAQRRAVALELARGREDARVFQGLHEVGLAPLVLKGAAYGRFLYAAPHLRPRTDTDLWFPDQAAAEQALDRLAREGYEASANVISGRYVSRQRTCVKPVAGGHALDLHWAISNCHSFARALPFPDLAQDALPLPALHAGARTLGPVDGLFYACLHLFGHGVGDRVPLIWLYDILLLGRRLSAEDWDAFARKAVAKGLAGICRHSLDRVDAAFRLPEFRPASRSRVRPRLVAAEAGEHFRPQRLRNPFLFRYYDLQALDGPAARLQWLRETIFPSAAYMRSKYGIDSKLWLPLLYLRRAAFGVVKRARRRR